MSRKTLVHQWHVLTVILIFVFAYPMLAQTDFDPGCPIPFGNLRSTGRPVDHCGMEGVGSTKSQLAQNQAKNNLCLAAHPVPVTQLSFVKLQAAVEQKNIPFGTALHLPPDRALLHDLYTTTFGDRVGEGVLVAYVGYVLNAHYSDVSSGESVNCKLLGKINNDIHITLAPNPSASPCEGIVAEIIPHFRPLAWEDIVTMRHDHPVRIIGQLFFDASHHPCREGKPASPPRISLWEIHPIYSMDICKGTTPAQCHGDDPQAWVPFDQANPSSKRATDAEYR